MTGISGPARYLVARKHPSFYDFTLLWNNRWERLPEMSRALEKLGGGKAGRHPYSAPEWLRCDQKYHGKYSSTKATPLQGTYSSFLL